MEGYVHPGLPFTRLPDMFRALREGVDAKIRGLSCSHKVYPGLDAFAAGRRVPVKIEEIAGEGRGWDGTDFGMDGGWRGGTETWGG